MIGDLSKRLKESDIQLEITEKARDLLAGKGYDKSFGARPLARTIQKFIETPLSLKIIDGEITKGKILIDVKDKEFIFKEKK
jgi:ATP-dependent Clp protease ATP-binding subunit ClpA